MSPGEFLGDDTQIWLFMAGPLVVFLLLIFVFSSSGKDRIARRIDQIKLNHDKKPETKVEILSARRHQSTGPFKGLDQLLQRMVPRQELLRLRLERAGLEMGLGTYSIVCIFVATCGFVAGILSSLPIAAAVLAGVFAGLGLPHYVVGYLHKRRQMKFINYFPDAIDLMVRGVRAGLPITESIRAAGEEIPDPVSIELRRITDGLRLGRKLDELLNEVSRRLDLPEFNFFTIALSIQSETGGNLAETLNNLSEVLRGRRQLKRKIRALSSEAKASAYIIGSLPFIMCLLIYLVNSGYIMGLFNDPRGQFMVGFGLFMIALGAFVMNKMIKFEV